MKVVLLFPNACITFGIEVIVLYVGLCVVLVCVVVMCVVSFSSDHYWLMNCIL